MLHASRVRCQAPPTTEPRQAHAKAVELSPPQVRFCITQLLPHALHGCASTICGAALCAECSQAFAEPKEIRKRWVTYDNDRGKFEKHEAMVPNPRAHATPHGATAAKKASRIDHGMRQRTHLTDEAKAHIVEKARRFMGADVVPPTQWFQDCSFTK